MGLYYNKSQSPVPVTLSGGRAILIPSRGRDVITGEDESAPALLAAIQAGRVVKLPAAFAARVAAVPAPIAAPVMSSTPLPTPSVLPPLEVSVVLPPLEVPVVSAKVLSVEVSAPEIQNEVAPSDDGSGSAEIVDAIVVEPSIRADGPRRERRR